MLVLSRHPGEEIVIGENIVVRIMEVRGDKVSLGITAPRTVPVNRREIAEAIKAEQQHKS